MSGSGLFMLRKDPALKGMLASVPTLTLIGLAIRFSAGEKLLELSEPGWSGFTIFMFMVVWGVMLFHVVGTGFWSRCSRIAMVLPIAARELWAWRVLAVTVSVVFPVACMTLAMGAGNGLALFLLGGKVLAVLLLLLAIGQNPFPKLSRIPVSAPYVVFLIFLSVLALVYLLITPATGATILIPAVLALLIGVKTVAAVPGGFLTAPDQPGYPDGSAWWKWLDPQDLAVDAGPGEAQPQQATAAAEPWVAPEMTYRQVLHMTLFRTLVNRVNVWLIGLVLVLVGMAILYEYFEGQGNWLPLCYTPLWFLALMQQAPRWIGPLAPLPIPRTLIFRYIAGALLLPTLIGGIFGFLLVLADKPVLVDLDNEQGIELKVPFEYWELVPAGESPVAVSPWGERLQLPVHVIAPGYGKVACNPFAVGEASSERFAAWQQARAIQAIYGLEQMPDPSDPQVPAGARSRLHNRTWGLGLLLVSLFLVAGLMLVLRQARTRLGRVLLAGFIPSLGVLVGLVILAMLVGPSYGVTSREALDALPILLMGKVAGEAGISGGGYLVLSAVVLIVGYFLVGRAFHKVEPDPTPTKTIAYDYRF